MDPVERAVWFIEANYGRDLSLDDVAAIGGVSRFHMSRAFAAATGRSVLRYVRGRRMTEAARILANGAPDILSVALDAGYNSHEAFTRAFRDHFGLTPEQVRASASVATLPLVEPLQMHTPLVVDVKAIRFFSGKSMLMAGLGIRLSAESNAGIPELWQRLGPHLGHIPHQLSANPYGVLHDFEAEGDFGYLAGVEVSDASDLPAGFISLKLPPQHYAVFEHAEHISSIRTTMHSIWSSWLPASGQEPANAPTLEVYGPGFDPLTGDGGMEIWIPLKR